MEARLVQAASPFSATLAGRYYRDPLIFAQELERIFSRRWVCVGRAEHPPRAGPDYFLAELADESVIVVRGRDGTLRGFLNVCRHRGARLCREERGHVERQIQCPYHAWSYGLDGRLLAAPNCYGADGRLVGEPNLLAADTFDREGRGLVPVALETWEGLVWLNLAEQPPTLAAQLTEPIIRRYGEYPPLTRYRLGELRVGHRIEYDVRANWKLMIENFTECYHCAPIHPELCKLVPRFRVGNPYDGGVGALFDDGIEAFTFSGKASRPRLPGLEAVDDRRYASVVLLPNVFLNLLPDHVVLHVLTPRGPERTRVACEWLFDPFEVARTEFDPTDVVEVFDLVNRQDFEACELVQQSMGSRAYRAGGLYVPAEQMLRGFNEWVLEQLESSS